MPPCFEMRGLSKRFGATAALDGVDLCVAPGEAHALVGENGAGKSTLMKILAGAERADAGEMRLAGRAYRPSDPLDARRRGIAMIYQELSLADHLTVEENISLGLEPSRGGVVRFRFARERARAALAQLGHGDLPAGARTGGLSVAERQVVEIARAVATGCRVLVLDEPTSSLGQADVVRLFALIGRLKKQDVGVVYISHFIEEVKRVGDRYTVLRDGAVAGGGRTEEATVDGIVSLMIGRRLERLYPRTRRAPGEEVLRLENLSGVERPTGACLALRRGEVLGIAGLIGAGRTELLRAVFGLDAVKSGRVAVGAAAFRPSPPDMLKAGAGFLSEDRKGEGLAVGMSVAENMVLSRPGGVGRFGFVAPRRVRAAAGAWSARLGIRCRDTSDACAALSGGNQQKVAMARLLYQDADVLLLDEPTRGIDVASKAQIYGLIDRLACGADRARACAVLMVSSYLPELLGMCDRIAVMCRGRLGEARPAAEWDEQSLLRAAAAGEAA
ncbi:MAG: sugar ABC transporter ATP-binding protein [Lentisphaerae bacterium]|nr:sugar ABC transporter ATP-binding protein [Lentisphaerota bacterium]